MMLKLMKNLNIYNDYVKFISPTYKHTITDEVYNYHCKEQLVLRMRPYGPKLKKAELSITLNMKANFENIVRNFKSGIFLIFESDVMVSKDIDKLNDFLNEIQNKNWDCIHLGMFQHNIFDIPTTNWITGYRNFGDHYPSKLVKYIKENSQNNKYIEDIKKEDDKYRLVRKFHPRCMDSFIWKYNGIVKFLEFIKKIEKNLSCPLDYIMIDFLENNINFKHYWSVNEFFKQGSNLGFVSSKIQ
jgi:hypothetical protein